MLDVNGKPFLHTKGIVTQNIQSHWKILCDDNGDFQTNATQIANDICNVIGFKFVEMQSIVSESQTYDFQVSKVSKSSRIHIIEHQRNSFQQKPDNRHQKTSSRAKHR
jgi:hypothetical protein